MVDEYQDTNLAQERLVELLGGPDGDVFVVGDDDQSIYRFRGASRASMERFATCFPDATELTLGVNRRSSGSIVASAGHLIAGNRERLPKTIAAARAPGKQVRAVAFADGRKEAVAVADEAIRLVRSGLSPHRIAILTRTHAIARPLVEALERAGVEYQHWSRQGFYERAEVRDLIACLRLLRNPDDLLALVRAAAAPPLQMEVPDIVALARAGAGAGESALAALATSPQSAAWAAHLLQLSEQQTRLGVDQLFFELMERTRYLEAWPAGPDRDRVTANISRFAELVDEYCERRPDHSLRGFLEHIDLVMLSGLDEELPALETAENALQVMTIHQAKGLEFEAVFIPSLVEGRLPQPARRDRSESRFDLPPQLLDPGIRGREDHFAEERRLCYVAMTRARRHLWLSWAARYEGPRSWQRSRFLDELDELVGSTLSYEVRDPGAGAQPAEVLASAAPAQAALGRHLTLSFSALSAYRECPRRYWLRYEQRLPAPPTVEGQFGSVVHDALRRAGRMRRQGEVEPEQLRQAYAEAWAEVDLVDPRRRPALEALGWGQLERYHAAGGFDHAPHLVEHGFTADLDTWSLRGIIDRVDAPPGARVEDGEVGSSRELGERSPWRLIDYKTGSPLPASSLRRDLQLALYALGAAEALHISPLELEIVYLQTGRSIVLPASDELVQEAVAVGEEVATGIRSGRFEARPDRRRCRLCPYRLACRAGL
jgi:ATP-dependent exoDNAse (exonuclease V) beta subunit